MSCRSWRRRAFSHSTPTRRRGVAPDSAPSRRADARPGAALVKTHVFSVRSELPGASRARVWAHVIDWRRINQELAPMAMSHPARFPTLAAVPADGQVHVTSVLSYRGIPFDRHRLALTGLRDGDGFDECSSNLLLRRWTHSRWLEENGRGVVVTDRCSLEARLPLLGGLAAAVYRRVFARRHRRLRAAFAR